MGERRYPSPKRRTRTVADPETLDRLEEEARRGDRRATSTLLGHLPPLVCRWALVWTGSPDLAEDVAQRVMVRVHRALPDRDPGGRLTTWLYRITHNALVDLDREQRRESALRDRLQLERLAAAAARRNGNSDARREAAEVLAELMEALSAQQRAALDLVELQGFSTREAGEMLGIAPATVRVHLHRARATLQNRSAQNPRE